MSEKIIIDRMPHTQHRPISVSVKPVVVPQLSPFRIRINLGGGELNGMEWNGYSTELEHVSGNYNRFVEYLSVVSQKYIPRGCRT